MSDDGERQVLQVRAFGVCIYALRDGDETVLIDSGFLGASGAVSRALRQAGWNTGRITGIILTHGHLDHAFNAFRFAREFGAWVAAPELDKEHVYGRQDYTGAARICGWLEAGGRKLFGYQPPSEVEWYRPGHVFDFFGGLEVVGLPGHTVGHCGLLDRERRQLFCGDLFASYWWSVHRPPAILNTEPDRIQLSIEAALALDIGGVWPGHCDRSTPETHLRRLRRLAK